jgi:Tfp pilus assembly protein PilX
MPKIFLIIAGTRGRKQRGEILITTLIFVMLGFLIVFPLLAFMATGLNSSRLYTVKNGALYSADAGIEDAIWQIKYEHLSSLLNDPAEYDEYDFETTWQYTLPVELNQNQVEVTVNNVWIPYGIDTPTITAARAIANNNRLLVTGGMQGGTTDGYHATVTYYPATGEDLLIDSIGVWLPPGFSYTAGSSNVENAIGEEYYAVPEVIAYKGGYVIIWDFASVDILDFPNVDTLDYPMTCDVTFNFTADKPDTIPDAVCWLETSGVSGMEFCWDYDVKVFKITSTADSTSIETYVVKSELRQLNGALNGDYIATGNTLMQDAHYDSGHIRDSWLNAADHSSSASIDTIDSEAEVAAAFLYWTGWKKESEITYVSPLNPEDCSDMTAWNVSSPNAWSVSSGAYQGHYSTGDSREIHLAANINLSAYSDAKVALCWQQKVGGPQTLTTFSEGFSTTTNWTLGSSWSLNTSTGQMNAHFSGGAIAKGI